MARVVELSKLQRERRLRNQRVGTQQCVEIVEFNLKISLDEYFRAPRRERVIRATRVRKLSELLEYTLQLL